MWYIYIYIDTHTHTQNEKMKICHKKNENLPFETTQMNLEGIVLSKISQTKINTLLISLYMESK